jgi:branched-chain amino acid transport system substrate-binding protein
VARAVAEANARGGYDGLPFEVVLRAEDGPWGSGSKQVTALAVEDSVWVILGGLDGGGAHLAEMIAAKLWVPVITITAADRTIDFANVPWVFRCFPSDDRQACALLNYARGCAYDSLVVFSEAAREGRTGARRLLDAAHRQQVLLAGPLEYDPRTPEACLGSADLGSADAVLIWGPAASGQALLRALRHEGFPGPVLGPACLLSEELLQGGSAWGEVTVAAPYDWGCENPRRREFCRRYEAEAGRTCEPTAVFAFDAACMAMTAIQQAGLNRARIRDALASGSFPTAAGFLRFDSLGGSSVEPVLLTMREGIWAAVDPGER